MFESLFGIKTTKELKAEKARLNNGFAFGHFRNTTAASIFGILLGIGSACGDVGTEYTGPSDAGQGVEVPPPPPDTDGDGVIDEQDKCIGHDDKLDRDSDGIPDDCDNCPGVLNADQADPENDGVGTVCDNCPDVSNRDQSDADIDRVGDACDKCKFVYNPRQEDTDGDNIGDACDDCTQDSQGRCQASILDDHDRDGIQNSEDNCPGYPNASQTDTDHDEVGDACDCDPDDINIYPGNNNGEVACDGKDSNCDGREPRRVVFRPQGRREMLEIEDECECVNGDVFNVNPATGLEDPVTGVCTPVRFECQNGAIVGPTRSYTGPSREVCDDRALDEDCDGSANEGCECTESQEQECGSNEGECRKGRQTCELEDNNSGQGLWSECRGERKPAERELCDGLDNDCDGSTDEGFNVGRVCTAPGECGAGQRECADLDTTVCSVAPGGSNDNSSEEICDGKDNDCDRLTDEGFDVGTVCRAFGVCGEHEGHKECLNTGRGTLCSTAPRGSEGPARDVAEVCCNRLDDDCDGSVDEGCVCACVNRETKPCGIDTGECVAGTQTCIDGVWQACEGDVEPQAEKCNSKDEDCNGVNDDPFRIGQSCIAQGACGQGVLECATDTATRCSTGPNGSASRVANEVCDSADNDCDGSTDEGINGLGNTCNLPGICGNGFYACDPNDPTQLSVRCSSIARAVAEVCDSEAKDEDCDGSVNEGCVCTPNAEKVCGTDEGECVKGLQRCTSGAVWGTCEGNIAPAIETCDGRDNDCDESTDEDLFQREDRTGLARAGDACVGYGVCEVRNNDNSPAGTIECAASSVVRCDTSPNGSDSRASEEVCNGQDDNCNNQIDEGFNIGAECDPAGECGRGTIECASIRSTRCSTGPGGFASEAEPEVCDGLDNDCDGAIDEGLGLGLTCDPPGACGQGVQECDPVTQGVRCSTGPGGFASQVSTEICGNGIDEDCDGSDLRCP